MTALILPHPPAIRPDQPGQSEARIATATKGTSPQTGPSARADDLRVWSLPVAVRLFAFTAGIGIGVLLTLRLIDATR